MRVYPRSLRFRPASWAWVRPSSVRSAPGWAVSSRWSMLLGVSPWRTSAKRAICTFRCGAGACRVAATFKRVPLACAGA